MSVSHRALAQLRWEVQNINSYLDKNFYPSANGRLRLAQLGATHEYIIVQTLPLPDRFSPDYADVLLIVDSFPARPPNGIHMLNRNNESLLNQLRQRFNAFQDSAFHGAQAIPGYTWICFHYDDNSWRYRVDAPARGDNICKFLANFLAELDR